MAIEKTGWRPVDVCNCYLEFEFEQSEGWAGGVRVTKAQKCAAHASVPDSKLHSVIWKESQLRMAAIVEIDKTGASVLVADSRFIVPYSFVGTGENRELVVRAGDLLMESEKAALQSVLDLRFGVGRVTVS